MTSRKEVAQWMYEELMRDGELSQRRARTIIVERFGRQFVQQGRFSEDLLVEWRKLTKGKVLWDAPEWTWRLKPDEAAPE